MTNRQIFGQRNADQSTERNRGTDSGIAAVLFLGQWNSKFILLWTIGYNGKCGGNWELLVDLKLGVFPGPKALLNQSLGYASE